MNYSVEKRLVGTGGAIRKAGSQIKGKRLLVVNGDTFLGIKVRELVNFHQSRCAEATLAAVKVTSNSSRYGSLSLDTTGRITEFLEKRIGHEHGGPCLDKRDLINGGVYVFEKKLLTSIRARGPVSLEREVLPSLVAKRKVFGFECNTFFLDIGIPEDLTRAQRELPE